MTEIFSWQIFHLDLRFAAFESELDKNTNPQLFLVQFSLTIFSLVQFSVDVNKFLINSPRKSRVVVVNAKYHNMQMKIQNYLDNITLVGINFGRNNKCSQVKEEENKTGFYGKKITVIS